MNILVVTVSGHLKTQILSERQHENLLKLRRNDMNLPHLASAGFFSSYSPDFARILHKSLRLYSTIASSAKMADRTKSTTGSIDCALWQMCREMKTKKHYTRLREPLPVGVIRSKASELMTTWILMEEMLDTTQEIEQSVKLTRWLDRPKSKEQRRSKSLPAPVLNEDGTGRFYM